MKIKLYCLPYAGGMASVYYKWKHIINDCIEVIPIDYAGHGVYYDLPCFTNMKDLVSDVISKMSLDEAPYAIFGHSFGALVAYEVVTKLHDEGYHDPIHVFYSSHESPEIRPEKEIFNLSDNDFIAEMSKLGGTPNELCSDLECFKFFLPSLRADYRIEETYKFNGYKKINCDISVFHGQDDVKISLLKNWKYTTNKECSYYTFPGTHFYINEISEEVVKKIDQLLEMR